MKKAIYSLMAVCALSLGFVSCSDDDAIDHGTHAQKPEVAAKGDYTGTLSIYEASLDAAPVLKENSVVNIAEGENPYTAVLTMTSGQADADGSIVTNISWSNNDFKFAGFVPANTNDATSIGNASSAPTIVNGEIVGGKIKVSYSKTVRSGRSTKTFFYKFEGSK